MELSVVLESQYDFSFIGKYGSRCVRALARGGIIPFCPRSCPLALASTVAVTAGRVPLVMKPQCIMLRDAAFVVQIYCIHLSIMQSYCIVRIMLKKR